MAVEKKEEDSFTSEEMKQMQEKMSLLLTENDIPHIYNESVESKLQEGNVLVTKGALSSGFESYDLNLLVISSEDFFNNERKKEK